MQSGKMNLKSKSKTKTKTKFKSKGHRRNNSHSRSRSKSGKEIITSEQLQRATLGRVLSDPKALTLFMQHLAQEFAMESLLSLIEFIQFQNYVFNHIYTNIDYLGTRLFK